MMTMQNSICRVEGKLLFASLCILSIIANLLLVAKQEVNPDACYYLGVSDLICKGYTPFKDFALEYTPLSFYIMSLVYFLFGKSFVFSLIISIIIQYLNAYLIYFEGTKVTNSKTLPLYPAILYLMLCIMWGGGYELEPFVVLFGLLSLVYLHGNKNSYLLISGFLSFCSFWSKQYGLGFFFLSIIYIVVDCGFQVNCIKKVVFFFIGFVSASLFFLLVLYLQGVDLLSMGIDGSAYDKKGLSSLFEAYELLIKVVPLTAISVLIALLKYKKLLSNASVIVFIFGILGFMLQCYVRLYGHYLLLVTPFCGLLVISVYDFIKNKAIQRLYHIAVYLSLLIPLFYASKSCVIAFYSTAKDEQFSVAQILKKELPENTDKVFVSQDFLYVSYLNSYTPPSMVEYGMSNGFMEHSEEIMKLCEDADYCILDLSWKYDKRRFPPEVIDYISNHFESSPFFCDEKNIIGYLLKRKK